MPEISRDDARKLVGRFSEFAAPPAMNEGLSQTIDTLIASARSMSHAKRIVETIIDAPGGDGDKAPRWPTSQQIRKVAWDLLSDDERSVRCDRCGGSGFIHEKRVIRGVEYDTSRDCSCRPAPPPAKEQPKRDGLQSAGELAERYR